MFRAYSRRVDRRVFSSINRWLGEREHEHHQRPLLQFAKEYSTYTPQEFYAFAESCKVIFRRTSANPWAYSFKFPSPLPSAYPRNDQVQGKGYIFHPLSAPSVVVVPGWLEGHKDFSRMASWAALSGRNLFSLELPYHCSRAPEGTKSGEFAVTRDIVRTLAAVRQAVMDGRVLVRALHELGSEDIAFLGFSLGGWVGSLLCASEPLLDRAILVTPVLRSDNLILESSLFSALRKGMSGEEVQAFENIKHLFLPLYSSPLPPPAGVTLLGSSDDPLAPPGDLYELTCAWGCRHEILPGGHITVYFVPRLWRRIFTLLSKRR